MVLYFSVYLGLFIFILALNGKKHLDIENEPQSNERCDLGILQDQVMDCMTWHLFLLIHWCLLGSKVSTSKID